IHHHSRRSSRPFIAVNCAALPEGLLESEMFGHRKGAFTGAVRDKPGLLEAAHGGTLFLDELIEMSQPIQAKLARGIQDGDVRELQNVIEHVAVVAEPGSDVRVGDLNLHAGLEAVGAEGGGGPVVSAPSGSLISTLLEESYHAGRERVIAQFERQYLTWLVSRATGNMCEAARIAGVNRATLYRLMERHGLQRSPSAGWVIERETAAPPPDSPAGEGGGGV